MSDLLPCPFCGDNKPYLKNHQIRKSRKRMDTFLYWYYCPSCQAQGPNGFVTVEEAQSGWNTRIQEEASNCVFKVEPII